MRDIYASETGLLTALHTIQDECKRHDDTCTDCPFRIKHNEYNLQCGIRSRVPEEWDINDITDWRAFK